MREVQDQQVSQVELFLNSVPILSPLAREERLRLVDALEEVQFPAGAKVITEGDKGDLFYIIKEGEAIVYQNMPQGQRKVNHLFKADFFGERALLCDEPRCEGWMGLYGGPGVLFWPPLLMFWVRAGWPLSRRTPRWSA